MPIEHKNFDDYRHYYEHECWNDVPVKMDSYEKPRIVYAIEKARGKRILDACCMDGAITAMIAQHHKEAIVVGMDISKRFIDKAMINTQSIADDLRMRLLFRHGAVEDLIFKDEEKFDCIICSEAIEHVYDLTHFLNCLVQYGKSGARLVLTTPLGFWDSPEHIREFPTPESLKKELEAISGLGDIHVDTLPDDKGNGRWLGVTATIGVDNG